MGYQPERLGCPTWNLVMSIAVGHGCVKGEEHAALDCHQHLLFFNTIMFLDILCTHLGEDGGVVTWIL